VSGILLPAGCCCIERGYDCGYCDFTPKYWTVTLSGIESSACTSCTNCSGASESFKDVSLSNLDGVHLLTQIGSGANACLWAKENFGSWSYKGHGLAANCAGDVTNRSGSFSIYLRRTELIWELAVCLIDTLFSGRQAFYDSVAETADDDCLNIAAMANSLSCWCGTSEVYAHIADGGAATFEPGDRT